MRKLLILFFFILFIGQASAGQYSVNGTTYDFTWDGRVIPSSQIVYGSNDDVILVQELTSATAFTVGNDTIWVNNSHTSFRREKFKISPIMTFPKSLLASRMKSVNATVGYLVFPYSLSRVKDFISDNEIRMGNWTFRAGVEHIDIYDDNQTILNGTQNILNKSAYTFRVVNDEIRLYFLKSEANKLQGNITFEMNSWTINGSTTPTWINTAKTNVTEDLGDHKIKTWFFADNFDDGVIEPGYYIIGSGMTFVPYNGYANVTGSGYNAVYTNISMPTAFNYSVNFRMILSGSTALNPLFHFRLTGTSSNYFLSSYSGSWKIYQYPGYAQMGGTYGNSFPANTWTNVKIHSNGSFVNTFINGAWDRITFTDATYPTGSIGFGEFFGSGYILDIDNITVLGNTTSGNLSAWYDSGSGNNVYQIDVNATTPVNTNYTLTVMNNDTDAVIQTWTAQTGNNSFTITGAVQDTKVNVTLNGNQTATPELMQVTFFDQAAGGGLNCGLNTLTNVTLYVNGSSTTCSPTNGTAAITMNYAFPSGFSATNDYYIFNMTTATATSRIFNESSNNNSLGIQLFHGGLNSNTNYSVNISNTTQKIFSFYVKSNSTGWIQYNTSVFNQSRYTVITQFTPSNLVLVYGVIAVVIISGIAYILRRVKKV